MSIEAMKLALEALESAPPPIRPYIVKMEEAITALRQAIEQAQKQEPVAYTVNVKCQRCGSAETYDLTIDAAHGIKEST